MPDGGPSFILIFPKRGPVHYAAPKDSEGLVIEFEIPSQNDKGPKRKL
jgi:hypothetical protein